MRYLMTLGLACVLAVAAVSSALASTRHAAGVQVGDPYRAVVPVADTSAGERDQAFAAALAQVIQRVSGNAPPAAVLTKASTYVQQYHYARAPAGSAQPFQLVVRFAPTAIEHLQRTLAAPAPAATAGMGGSVASGPVAAGKSSLVWVSGVHSALDFAEVVAALEHAPGVQGVGVRGARGDGMLLRVQALVPLARILEELGSGSHLSVSATAHTGAAASLRWSR